MFLLYLKPGCPHCSESKKLILKNNLPHKFIEISDYDKREELKVKNNMDTFPQIFLLVNKKKYKIGGNHELKQKIIFCKKLSNSIIKNTLNTDLNIAKLLHPNNKKINVFINKNKKQKKSS